MYEELKNFNILYAEDDDYIRVQTTALLKILFNKVYVAQDGIEALELFNLHHNELDVVVTDINMPKFCGIDLAKHIKEKIDTPIIAVSAYSKSDYELDDLEKIFSFYLRKPIQIKDLILNIEKAIKKEEGEFYLE